ncbi:MAG TPA: DUF4266 domain-containing protein [Verrucomicrobiae bacterium]|nr:DUF4266 domain-containing protein [Verrucomicrobiae bacterium]
MKLKLIFTVGVGALLFTSGCTTVQPWERGTLADETMQPDLNPIPVAQADHIYFSREQATGGGAVGGGGCGCN